MWSGATHATVCYNIIYDCGYEGDRGAPGSRWVGLSIWGGVQGGVFRNNDIYSPHTRRPVVYREDAWNTSHPVTVSAFNAKHGDRLNSISADLGADPLLTGGPHTEWYTPRPGSPCRGSGWRWWGQRDMEDYDGRRPPASTSRPPDIGAFQAVRRDE